MTGRLRLSFATRTNPRVQELVDDPLAVEGVELLTSLLPPADTFWRQLRFGEFDISEMSLSVFMRLKSAGDTRWTALPIFPDRRFFHAWMVVRKDSEISRPEDLRGARLGVPDYSQTAALWGRGILKHDFGVDERDVLWFQERTDRLSHGGATAFDPPSDVQIEYIGAEDSQRQMLADGRLDASILFLTYTTLLDRSSGAMADANVRPLFADPDAEKARAYSKWGFLPFNHCMVIRSSLVEEHPWLPLNLYTAFHAAKEAGRHSLAQAVQPHVEAGLAGDGMAVDLFPYGIDANRAGLVALTQFAFEQGLTPHVVQPEHLFHESLQDL